MAQQTQISRVVPVYRRFLLRFPTPAACASAPLGDVLRMWTGLGYNRRARFLHAAASAMVANHGGEVPSDLASLMALPGVGAYTARAVLAFAFGVDVGVVDTNAGRVLARAAAGTPLRPADAQSAVDAMVPPGRGWEFNQAILDLGAMICMAGAPECGACPIRRRCRWAATGFLLPDPVKGSAGAGVPQGTFEGSDRQGRGRLLQALCRGQLAVDRVGEVTGWTSDPDRVQRVVADLVAEGMMLAGPGGVLALP